LIGLTDEMLSSSENRAELLGRLLIVVNDDLINLELGAVVEDIVITDLALTQIGIALASQSQPPKGVRDGPRQL
jgi:hypothetical protein